MRFNYLEFDTFGWIGNRNLTHVSLQESMLEKCAMKKIVLKNFNNSVKNVLEKCEKSL